MTSTGTTPVVVLAWRKNRRAPSPSRRTEPCPSITRPIQPPPPTAHLDIGLIPLPTVADPTPTEPSRVGQQRRKPPHPPVHGDLVDVAATFGQEFRHVPIGQPEPQIPPHRQHDHVRREAK